MDDELKELFRELEEQGWEPMLCDTPVPYFDNKVMCGEPNYIGDIEAEDEVLLPGSWTKPDRTFISTVQGDSMKDADILEGDKVVVEKTRNYQDGDIVLVSLDEAYTLKAFCHDDDGMPWLVPMNADYKPFPLNTYQDIRVEGVVKRVIKISPRVNFTSCLKKIKAAKLLETAPKVYTKEDAGVVIKIIAPEIIIARLWYAVFRVLMEKKVIASWDYDDFCVLVKKVVPDHLHLPTRLELQRMAVKSFTKPVSLWEENDAPVQGKRYEAYIKIAMKTKELIEQP